MKKTIWAFVILLLASFSSAQVFAQSWVELPMKSKRHEAAIDESGALLNGNHQSTLTLRSGEKLITEVLYVDGFENGLMTVTDKNNSLRYEIPFEKGAVNGLVKGYGFGRQENYFWEAQYVDGEQHGYSRRHNRQKVIYLDETYEHGYKHGWAREYYNTGALSYEVNMVYGRPEGMWQRYYPDGSLQESEFYKNGRPEGLWRLYNRDGALMREEAYENGQLKSRKYYD